MKMNHARSLLEQGLAELANARRHLDYSAPIFDRRPGLMQPEHGAMFKRSAMSKALTEITQEAIQLPRQQRLALAGLLLELEDGGSDPQADKAWEQEIQARIKAVDEGSAVGISYEEAMRQAQELLAP
jgi:hypothetical protein